MYYLLIGFVINSEVRRAWETGGMARIMRAVLELLRMKVWSGCFLTRPAYADGAFLGEGLPLLALLDMAVMNRSGRNGRMR